MQSPHYIGAGPQYGAFAKQIITGNSSTTAFALTYITPSSSALMVFVNNVIKNPDVDYSVTDGGNRITFVVAPSGADNVYIRFLGAANAAPAVSTVETDAFTGDGGTTAFAMTTPPYSASNIIIFVDGISQKLTTNYTLSGSTVTFTSAPDNGSLIEITHIKVQVQADWQLIPSTVTSFTAINGGKYLIDANSAGTTAYLPASPTVGYSVRFINVSTSNYDVNINRNGEFIYGLTGGATGAPVLANQGEKKEAVYVNSSIGWATI